MPLPRAFSWVVRAVVPGDRAETVISDLEQDYEQHRALPWLVKETASLVIAYVLARAARWRRSVPLLMRDVHMVGRGLRRGAAPLVAAAALLAVGLAAVMLAAGLADTLLLREVSSTHGKALRRIVAVDRQGRSVTRFSFPELQQIREHVGDGGTVTAVYLHPVVLRANNSDVHTMAEIADGQYFALTGTTALLGRVLMSADDRRDAPPAAVLAEPFWRSQFGASPAVLGETVRLNGAPFTVVGVADTLGSSSFLGASVDAWVPTAHADPLVNAGWRTNPGDRWFTAFVLPVGSAATIDTRLAAAAGTLAATMVDPWRERRLQTADATVMVGSQRTAAATLSLVLAGLSALILLAAAANVGGVLLARAAANRRATAIHVAVGAGRGLVVRRQLMEGALAGGVAGVLAFALYAWARQELMAVTLLPTLSLRLELPLSPALAWLVVSGGAILGSTLALAPALWSVREDIVGPLRDDTARSGGQGLTSRVRRGLVSAQVCVSLVLLVGAVLFVRSLDALAAADLGFPRERLVAMDFDVEPVVQVPTELPALAREALARVAALPEVSAAAMANRAPVDQSAPVLTLQRPGDDSSLVGDVTVYLTTENYFDAIGVPLMRGRSFTAAEANAASAVAIVNQTLAARLWPEGDAVERALYVRSEAVTLRVIGIARDSKYRSLAEDARPHIYRPTAPALGLTLLARARHDPREALRAIQRELDQVGPGIVGFFPRTLDDHLAVQLLPTRAAARAASLLGVLSLCLSGAALYALVAWSVLLRRREIGVRMALGASRHEVRRLIIGQALTAAWPGLAVGVVLAIALGWTARSALFGVSPVDPIALGSGIGALALVVLLAGYVPSRAATAIDPAAALRP